MADERCHSKSSCDSFSFLEELSVKEYWSEIVFHGLDIQLRAKINQLSNISRIVWLRSW